MSADERTTLKLKHPIQFGQELIEELAFRRGRFGDLKGIRVGGSDISIDDLVTIASRQCGQPVAVIEKLDEEDAGEVFAIALGFYGRCLATGAVASQS